MNNIDIDLVDKYTMRFVGVCLRSFKKNIDQGLAHGQKYHNRSLSEMDWREIFDECRTPAHQIVKEFLSADNETSFSLKYEALRQVGADYFCAAETYKWFNNMVGESEIGVLLNKQIKANTHLEETLNSLQYDYINTKMSHQKWKQKISEAYKKSSEERQNIKPITNIMFSGAIIDVFEQHITHAQHRIDDFFPTRKMTMRSNL